MRGGRTGRAGLSDQGLPTRAQWEGPQGFSLSDRQDRSGQAHGAVQSPRAGSKGGVGFGWAEFKRQYGGRGQGGRRGLSLSSSPS